MKARILLMATLLLGAPAVAFSQSSTQPADAAVIVSGEVVRYEPGKILVIRSEGKEVTYTISPSITIPSEVQVGKMVSVYTEHGPVGATVVSRVTTTSITPEGQTKRTTEETRTKPSGETSKTPTTTVHGTVQSYQPCKSITLLRSDGSTRTFTIGPSATCPTEITSGKTVTILTMPDGSVETIPIDKE